MKTTGETVRDSLSFIEKLNGKEIVELENVIDEALTTLHKEKEEAVKAEKDRIIRIAKENSCSAYFVHQGADYITINNLIEALTPPTNQ